MPNFAYKAMQRDGVLVEGSLDASNRQEAMRQVETRGLKPIRLAEAGATQAPFPAKRGNAKPAPAAKGADTKAAPAVGFKLSSGPRKITPRMLENFTRLLSSLLAAGVPFSRALVILVREAAEPVAKAKWKELHDLVIDGMSLSNAMAKSPDTFPRVYVAMVEAGTLPRKYVDSTFIYARKTKHRPLQRFQFALDAQVRPLGINVPKRSNWPSAIPSTAAARSKRSRSME